MRYALVTSRSAAAVTISTNTKRAPDREVLWRPLLSHVLRIDVHVLDHTLDWLALPI